MSYCRWSTDDFQCDVYVYADVAGGFTTHVAGNRPVLDVELPPRVPLTEENVDAWIERDRIVSEWIEKAERRPIGLPHDGDTFRDETADDAANTLQRLLELGYKVPQRAIDALRAEAADEAHNAEVTGRTLADGPVDRRVRRHGENDETLD
jgi:hypothetical protein